MKSLLFRVIVCLVFLNVACKDDAVVIDTERPKIEIQSPESYYFYAQGDTVFIKAMLSDNTVLRNGSIHIHDQFQPIGQDTVFSYEFKINTKFLELDTFWLVNDPLDKNYTIYFDAVDQSENLTSKKQEFYQYH